MNFSYLWNRIAESFSTRRLEQAQAEYETLLEIHPGSARLWLRHAEICKRLHRGRLAAVSYRTAGMILRDQHRFAQAAAALKMSLALNPADRSMQKELIRIQNRIHKGISDTPSRRITERFIRNDALNVQTQIVEVEIKVEEPVTSPDLDMRFILKPAQA